MTLERMINIKKESIKIIIYEKDNKTRVKIKNKSCKKACKNVKDLHLVLANKIKDVLNNL